MSGAAPAAARPRRRRRWWLALVLPVGAYLGAWACGMEPALPFDFAINIGGDLADPTLRAPADGRRHLVVLQHGLWRTPWSLWRLERTLRAHGYDTLNPGYPSRSCTIETAAAMLHDAIERDLGARGPAAIAFVAHSMGGLVVEQYLRRADARAPDACVYVAVPHRGAVLCDLRKHWWPFPLLLGTAAAMQLSPGDPFHAQAIPFAAQSGCIVGNRGAGNASIPGDDDGTVATTEARLADAADTVELPLGHTAIAGSAATVHQVLHYLHDRRFAPEGR